jgi:Predicted 3'-5' exonuclease related to the exonuclease domain of PolB
MLTEKEVEQKLLKEPEIRARLEAIDRKFAPARMVKDGGQDLGPSTPSQPREFPFDRATASLTPVKPNWLVYDCEIINAIPDPKKRKDPNYTYCSGWTDFSGMGVAVIGYRIDRHQPSYCLSVEEFAEIVKNFDGVVVGFNSIMFDDRLLAAHGLPIKTGYDLLPEIRGQAGLISNPRSKALKGLTPAIKGKRTYKLDKIASFNNLPGKSMDGAMAPLLWQQGKHKEVIDYCLGDVLVTSQILELGLMGSLRDPNTGEYLLLPLPVAMSPTVAEPAPIRQVVRVSKLAAPVENTRTFGILDAEVEVDMPLVDFDLD